MNGTDIDTTLNFQAQLTGHQTIQQSATRKRKRESDISKPLPYDHRSPLPCDKYKEKFKILFKEVYGELEKVKIQYYDFYGPDLFTRIYKIKELLEIENIKFTELIQEDSQLGEINKKIVELFKEGEVANWMVEFVDRIPYGYFSGNYKADEVFKTLSGVIFTFDFWNETYDGKTLKELCEESFKWQDYKDSWLGPSWAKEIEAVPDTQGSTRPTFVPPDHWWWDIPEHLIDSTYFLESLLQEQQ